MRINKDILKKAESKGIISSYEEFINFVNEEKKSKIPILNIIGASMVIFGILLFSFMLINTKNQEVAGIIIFLTGLGLNFFVRNINKEDLVFKISNLLVFLLLCFGVLTGFHEFFQYSEENGFLIYSLKLIEIPAIILSLYFYIKHKNDYILVVPFLIINFMIFMVLHENFYRSPFENFIEKGMLIVYYFNLLILSGLIYFKKLKTKDNIAYIALILLYNISAFAQFIDIFRRNEDLIFIGLMLLSNGLLVLFNKFNDREEYNKSIYTLCYIWLFLIDYFESLIFVSFNIGLLAYGIFKQYEKLIRISVIVLVISIEQIVELEDLTQIIYYIVTGVILILLNNILNKKIEKNV